VQEKQPQQRVVVAIEVSAPADLVWRTLRDRPRFVAGSMGLDEEIEGIFVAGTEASDPQRRC
jgi:hypothetical protein